MAGESPRNARSGGQALKRERERRGWSRRYVADSIGSDLQSVGRWERGESLPTPYYRQRLCELFDRDARALGLLPDETSAPDEVDSAYTHQSRTAHQGEAAENEKEHHLNGDSQPVHSILPLLRLSTASRHPMSAILSVPLIVALAFVLLAWLWHLQASPASPAILPGGVWVSPIDGQSYRGSIHFAARAYPSSLDDPAISYVNFTAKWEGGWRVVCTVRAPVVADLYSCNVNLGHYGAPAGPIRISFDVYDQAGNVQFAPNGERTIIYTP